MEILAKVTTHKGTHCTIRTVNAHNIPAQQNTYLTLPYLTTRMWADAQRDRRPVEYRWRPLRKFSHSVYHAAKFG